MKELNLNEIVKIEQMPKVFEQLELVGTYIDEQLKDLDKMECTENNKQVVKNRRTEINNTLKVLEDKRKEIKNKINEPYDLFNKKYEETTKIKLQSAYKTLSEKIDSIENKQKLKKKQVIEKYFNEYAISKDIDFVKFEQLNLNITLSITEAKLKEQVKTFIDKVEDDLNLIVTQEHKQEIMIEYKKSLNVSSAISIVLNRYKELEELKQKEEIKQEELKQVQENVEEVEKVLKAPTKIEKEEIYEMTFKVRAIKEKLKAIKEFLDNGGYEYE